MSTSKSEIIEIALRKAGLNDEEITEVMSIEDDKIEGDIGGKILTGVKSLLSPQQAKNSGELKKHYMINHFSQVDKRVKKGFESLFPDYTEKLEEVFGGEPGDTGGKIYSLFEFLNDEMSNIQKQIDEGGKKGGREAEELRTALNERNELVKKLQNEFGSFKEQAEKEKQEIISTHQNEKIDSVLRSKLSGYQYVVPEQSEAFVNMGITELRKQYALKMLEDGNIGLFDPKDPEFPAQDAETSQPLNLVKALEKTVAPFIVKTKKDDEGNENLPKSQQYFRDTKKDPNGVRDFRQANAERLGMT